VIEGQTGYLFPATNPEELSGKIKVALGHPATSNWAC